jgi:hypothetical protein
MYPDLVIFRRFLFETVRSPIPSRGQHDKWAITQAAGVSCSIVDIGVSAAAPRNDPALAGCRARRLSPLRRHGVLIDVVSGAIEPIAKPESSEVFLKLPLRDTVMAIADENYFDWPVLPEAPSLPTATVAVTLDTNVYVWAFQFEVIRMLRDKFRWDGCRRHDARRQIPGFARLVTPRETLDIVKEGEHDNRILECCGGWVGFHHLRR